MDFVSKTCAFPVGPGWNTALQTGLGVECPTQVFLLQNLEKFPQLPSWLQNRSVLGQIHEGDFQGHLS